MSSIGTITAPREATSTQPVLYKMSLAEFLSTREGIELHSAGSRYLKCFCPFHAETDPSFTIYYREDGHATCYSCKRRFGDVIDYVKATRFPGDQKKGRAMAWCRTQKVISDRPVAGWGTQLQLSERKIERRPASMAEREAMTIAFSHFSQAFLGESVGAPARAHLRERGVTGPMQEFAQATIGYVPAGQVGRDQYRTIMGQLRNRFGDESVSIGVRIGLLREVDVTSDTGLQKRYIQRLSNRLIFGCFDVHQMVTYYQARDLAVPADGRTRESTSKFLNPPSLAKALYIPLPRGRAYENTPTHIVEGGTDAYAYGVCGLFSASTLGSDIATLREQIEQLPKPWVASCDNLDTAGRTANEVLISLGARALAFPSTIKDPARWLAWAGYIRFVEQVLGRNRSYLLPNYLS